MRRRSPLIFRNAGEQVGRRRRGDLQLRRVLEDLRHDALEEAVVELDPALPERLLEHVVDERAVASLPASSRANATIGVLQVLVVEQREERDLERRIAPATPGAARPGNPGYSTSPTRTPDATSGGVAR